MKDFMSTQSKPYPFVLTLVIEAVEYLIKGDVNIQSVARHQSPWRESAAHPNLIIGKRIGSSTNKEAILTPQKSNDPSNKNSFRNYQAFL